MEIGDCTKRALLAALIVMLFGVLWILFSDTLLYRLYPEDLANIKKYQTFKGLSFILIISIIAFLIFRFFLIRQARLLSAKLLHQQRYETLFRDIPVGIYHVDRGGIRRTVNPCIMKLLGINEAEINSDEWLAMIDEKDRQRVVESWKGAFRNRRLFYEDYLIHSRDLKVIHLVDVAHPEANEQGMATAYMGTVSDITEIDDFRFKIVEKENLLKVFVENSPAAIAMFDTDMCYLLTSKQWLTDLGLEDADIIGKSHYEVSPDIPQRWKEVHQRCLAGASEKRDSDSFVRASGRIEYVRWEIHPWFKGSNEIGGVIIFSEVTTRRVLAMQRERALVDKLQLAITATGIGLFELDMDGYDLHISSECRHMLGLAEEETGNSFEVWRQRIHSEDRGRFFDLLTQAREQAPSHHYQMEMRLRRADDSWRHVLCQGKTIEDPVTAHTKLIGALVDLSSLRQAEESVLVNQNRLEHLLSSSPTVLYALDIQAEKLVSEWISNSVERVLGYTVEEAMTSDWWINHLHPQDREDVLKHLQGILDKPNGVAEYRFLHKRGHIVYVRDEFRTLRMPDGQFIQVVGSISDITEMREVNEKMRLFNAAIESTSDGVVVTDLNAYVVSVNKAFTAITGYTAEEVLGRNPRILQSGRHDRLFYKAMWDHVTRYGSWKGEIWNRRKDGQIYPQLLRIHAIKNEQGDSTHYMGVTTDLGPAKKIQEDLDRLTHFDVLTGLPNRLLLMSRLSHAIDQARRGTRKLGVFLLDLDDFRKVNDSLGHAAGDDLLLAVSKRLKARLREADTFGRFGGDEFLLIIEDVDKIESLGTLALDMTGTLRQPFDLAAMQHLQIKASIGIAVFPVDGVDAAGLLKSAETAMYMAKQDGLADYAYFTRTMGTAAMERLELEIALREGIASGELVLHYQPKANIASGAITGAEALVRWQRGEQGLVSPLKFIPVAEQTGLIGLLGSEVLNLACRQLRVWLDAGLRPPGISVNVAVQQFSRTDLVTVIGQALTDSGIEARYLEIEITESALMGCPEQAIETLSRLKKMGLKVSLDDFGTGYSNLSYLSRFPLDVLKVDASFIRQMHDSVNATKLVKSIIELGHNIDLRIVAEGVETVEQLDQLRNLGCDDIQGYYLSKPLPADEFEVLIKEQKSLYDS